MQLTLADQRAGLLHRVEENSAFYPQAELDDAINEASRVLQLLTGHAQVTVGMPRFSVANRVFYRVPDAILIPTAVYVEGVALRRTSLTSISQMIPDWRKQRTSDYGPPRSWIPIGIRQFAIHPIDSNGGRQMEVTGVAEISDLSSAEATLSVSDSYAEALEDHAFFSLVLDEGGKILMDALPRLKSFQQKARQLARWQVARNPKFWVEVKIG